MSQSNSDAKRVKIGSGDNVYLVAYSASGRMLAVGFEEDRVVKLYKVGSDGQSVNPEGYSLKVNEAVYHFAWHPKKEDIMVLVTLSGVKVWDTKSNKMVSQLSGLSTKAQARRVAISPDGHLLAVYVRKDQDNYLYLADLGKAKVKVQEWCYGQPTDLAFTRDQQQLLAAMDRGVLLYEVPALRMCTGYEGHSYLCESVAASPDNKWVATGGADAVLALWDLDAGVCVRSMTALDKPIRSCEFSADSSLLAYMADTQGPQVVHVPSGRLAADGQVNINRGSERERYAPRPCASLSFHPSGHVIAYAEVVTDNGTPLNPINPPLVCETTLVTRRVQSSSSSSRR